jgi:hypothetical protein
MGATSRVVVRDPVDVDSLFQAARQAAGGAPTWTRFAGPEYADVNMLRTDDNQGAAAITSVHFPPDGGMYPREDDAPDGYARVIFTSSYLASEAAQRRRHVDLVAGVTRWLEEQGLRWWWDYEDEPWQDGWPQGTSATRRGPRRAQLLKVSSRGRWGGGSSR